MDLHHPNTTDPSTAQSHPLRIRGWRFIMVVVHALTALFVGLAWSFVATIVYSAIIFGWFIWRNRHRLGHRRQLRSLRFTRDGKYLIGITVGIGLGAINTGNNLLYLFLGMLLSMIIVSGILSELTLKSIRAHRQLPPFAVATHPFLVSIEVNNEKEALPSFSLTVGDTIAQPNRTKTCFFLKLKARSQQSTSYRHTFSRRGVYDFNRLTVSTRFPFGFFTKSRRFSQPQQLRVVPEIRSVTQTFAPLTPSEGNQASLHRGQGQEFDTLREYQVGDSARDIHWKRSATRRDWVVRRYAQESAFRVELTINPFLPMSHPVDRDDIRDELDICVTALASLAHDLHQRGYIVDVYVNNQRFSLDELSHELEPLLLELAIFEFRNVDSITSAQLPGLADNCIVVSHPASTSLIQGSPSIHLVGPEVLA